MANFGSVSYNVLCMLVNQYCCSFYGSNLCEVNSVLFNQISVAWHRAVRRICKISNQTHKVLLPLITLALR